MCTGLRETHLKQCHHIVGTWGFYRILQKRAMRAQSTASFLSVHVISTTTGHYCREIVCGYSWGQSISGIKWTLRELSWKQTWSLNIFSRLFLYQLVLHLSTHLCIIRSAMVMNTPKRWIMCNSGSRGRAVCCCHENKALSLISMQWKISLYWTQHCLVINNLTLCF